jgi:hypothetical protein
LIFWQASPNPQLARKGLLFHSLYHLGWNTNCDNDISSDSFFFELSARIAHSCSDR